MKKQNECPVCGSHTLSTLKVDKLIQMDFFQEVEFEYKQVKCATCGFRGEDEKSYPLAFAKAKKVSDKVTVKCLIEQNRSKGIRDAYFERCFNLPSRTLNRWKSSDGKNVPNASAVSLLKLVNTFGWLAEVADHGYDPKTSDFIFKKNALDEINRDRKELGLNKAFAYIDHDCGSSTLICSIGKEDSSSAEIASASLSGSVVPVLKQA